MTPDEWLLSRYDRAAMFGLGDVACQRPMIELLDDHPLPTCLAVESGPCWFGEAASWPEPLLGADLEEEETQAVGDELMVRIAS